MMGSTSSYFSAPMLGAPVKRTRMLMLVFLRGRVARSLLRGAPSRWSALQASIGMCPGSVATRAIQARIAG